MRISTLITTFIFILLAFGFAAAQPTITIDRAHTEHLGGSLVTGAFRFQNSQSDLPGMIWVNTANGTPMRCASPNPNPCRAGQTVTIYESFTGSGFLRYGGDPTVVNGVTYPWVYYDGDLTFNGGTVRIPYYMAKKNTFKIIVKSYINGVIYGRSSIGASSSMFVLGINLTGTTTVSFASRNGNPANGYDIVNVVSDYPPPG